MWGGWKLPALRGIWGVRGRGCGEGEGEGGDGGDGGRLFLAAITLLTDPSYKSVISSTSVSSYTSLYPAVPTRSFSSPL